MVSNALHIVKIKEGYTALQNGANEGYEIPKKKVQKKRMAKSSIRCFFGEGKGV